MNIPSIQELAGDAQLAQAYPLDIHNEAQRRTAYKFLDSGPYKRYRYKVNSLLNDVGIGSASADELWSLLETAHTYYTIASAETRSDVESRNEQGMTGALNRDISLIQRALVRKTSPNGGEDVITIL